MIQRQNPGDDVQVLIPTSHAGLEQQLLQVLCVRMGRDEDGLRFLLLKRRSRLTFVAEDARQLLMLVAIERREEALLDVVVFELGRDTRDDAHGLRVEWNK